MPNKKDEKKKMAALCVGSIVVGIIIAYFLMQHLTFLCPLTSGGSPGGGNTLTGGSTCPVCDCSRPQCVSNWICDTRWSICDRDGLQYKTCYDSNNCYPPTSRPPTESQRCIPPTYTTHIPSPTTCSDICANAGYTTSTCEDNSPYNPRNCNAGETALHNTIGDNYCKTLTGNINEYCCCSNMGTTIA